MKGKDFLSRLLGNSAMETPQKALEEYDESITQYSAAMCTTVDIMKSRYPDRQYYDKEKAINLLLECFELLRLPGDERRVFKRILTHYMGTETEKELLTAYKYVDFEALKRYFSDLDYLSDVVPLAERDIEEENKRFAEERRKQEEEQKRLDEERRKQDEERRKREAESLKRRETYKPSLGSGRYESYAANYCQGWCGEMARALEDSNR